MTGTFSNPRIAALYDGIPAEQVARLHAFRARYPYQTATVQGRPWRYLDTGQGDSVLVLLGGGTLLAEQAFQTIEHFAQSFRVIAPDYPPVALQGWMDGLGGLLGELGIGPVVVLGGSYGGIMLQPWLRHSPGRIRRAVIAVAPPPDPARSAKMAASMRWLRLLPTFALRALIGRSFNRLSANEAGKPGVALAMALSREIVQFRLGRADLLAALQRVIEAGNAPGTPDDLQDWPGRLLLVFGSEDPGTPPDVREAMQRLYPQAEVRVFEGSGHTLAASRQGEYLQVIGDFLAG